MDIKLLKTFITLCKELNYHKTGKRLFLSQPTVTFHIRQLEEIVGFPLFERVGRNVKLSSAGERFRLHADRILEAHDEALSDLASLRAGYEERLDLLLAPLCAEYVLPLVWNDYTANFPHVELRIYTTLSPSVGPGIAAGRSHIGLSRIPSRHPDTRSELLYLDPVFMVAPTSLGNDSHYADLLKSQPLLMRNHPEYWDDIMYQLHDLKLEMRPMPISQVLVTKRLLEQGTGVSFLPLSSVRRELREGTLRIVPTPDIRKPDSGTYIITARDKGLSQASNDFLELLKLRVREEF